MQKPDAVFDKGALSIQMALINFLLKVIFASKMHWMYISFGDYGPPQGSRQSSILVHLSPPNETTFWISTNLMIGTCQPLGSSSLYLFRAAAMFSMRSSRRFMDVMKELKVKAQGEQASSGVWKSISPVVVFSFCINLKLFKTKEKV